MNPARKLIVLRKPNRQRYILSLLAGSDSLWLRFRETSGTTPVNSGSLAGLTIVWTPGTSGALGQTTTLGENEAYLFADGAVESVVTVTNDAALAALKNMTTQRGFIRFKALSMGEGNQGMLYAWGNYGGATNLLSLTATNKLDLVIRTDATIARRSTTQTDSLIGGEQIIAWDYDHAGTRKVRLWQLLGGVVVGNAQMGASIDQAGTGNLIAPTANLTVGNDGNGGNTFDGLIDEQVIQPGALWTLPELQQLAALDA